MFVIISKKRLEKMQNSIRIAYAAVDHVLEENHKLREKIELLKADNLNLETVLAKLNDTEGNANESNNN